MDKCDELLWGGVAGSAASTLRLLALCINSLALLSVDDRRVLADLQVHWWSLRADCWSYSLLQRQRWEFSISQGRKQAVSMTCFPKAEYTTVGTLAAARQEIGESRQCYIILGEGLIRSNQGI